MLDSLKVYDVPEWSVIFDVRRGKVYFKTRISPEIKSFSMADIDFSSVNPTLILDMDYEHGGDVIELFKPYSNQKFADFTEAKIFPILPEEFFVKGGITKKIYNERLSSHCDIALKPEVQFFTGKWIDDKQEIYIVFELEGSRVKAKCSNGKDVYSLNHLSLIGNKFAGTFRTRGRKIIDINGVFDSNKLKVEFRDARYPVGNWTLKKVKP